MARLDATLHHERFSSGGSTTRPRLGLRRRPRVASTPTRTSSSKNDGDGHAKSDLVLGGNASLS